MDNNDFHLCFDIDGTLLSTKGAGGRSFKKAIDALFKRKPNWEKVSMAGCLDPGIYREILKQLNISFEQKLWDEFSHLYLEFLKKEVRDTSSWEIFDGVNEILSSTLDLKRKPILMTGNIKEGAFLKLKAVGLEIFFDWDSSVFGDDGREKRDELAIAYREKNLDNLKPVVIGDTPNDIRLGRILNGISVAVSTGMHSYEDLKSFSPDYLINSLKDLNQKFLMN